MEEEIKSQKLENGQEDSMKIVLEAFDSSFSTGSFGLGYNAMSMSAVDELEIEGLGCAINEKKDKIIHTNTDCHYYREYFNEDLVDVWIKKEDPKCVISAQWKYSRYQEIDSALLQTNLYTIKSNQLKPSWILFIKDKICNIGVLLVEFIAKHQGMISIGFHFQNEMNHFQVQIFPDSLNKCNLIRKVINNEQLLKSNDKDSNCGYTIDQVYRVKIEMKLDKSIFYVFNKTIDDYQLLLEGSYDQEFPNTKFALGVLKTEVVFTRFEFMDHDYYELLYGSKKERESDSMKKQNQIIRQKEEQECYQYSDKQQQLKFCSDKFQTDFQAVLDCQGNFFDRCCFLQNPVEKSEQSLCIKKCQGNQKSEQVAQYKICIDSPQASKSIFTACSLLFQDRIEQKVCMRDMCQLCCATFNSIYSVSLDLETIRICRVECISKFNLKSTQGQQKSSTVIQLQQQQQQQHIKQEEEMC